MDVCLLAACAAGRVCLLYEQCSIELARRLLGNVADLTPSPFPKRKGPCGEVGSDEMQHGCRMVSWQAKHPTKGLPYRSGDAMCPPLSGMPLPWEHLAWPEPTILGALGAVSFVLVALVENDRRTLPEGKMRTRAVAAGLAVTFLIVGGGLLLFGVLLPWNIAIGTWYAIYLDGPAITHCSTAELHAESDRITGLLKLLMLGGPSFVMLSCTLLIRIWHGARERALAER